MPSASASLRPAPSTQQGRRFLLGFYLYLVVAVALPSQWLFWDDIGFLLAARAGELDYGHALYLPALRAAQWLASPFTDAVEYSAKLLSMLGGAVAFVLVWRRVERGGLRAPLALVVALFVTATPLFWRQLSLIEPATWTLVGLLGSAAAAEAHGRRRGTFALALAALAFALTLGLHLVSLCALPWLVWLARGPAPRPARRELFVLLAVAAALLALAELLGDPLSRIGGFVRYWRGFLPRAGDPSHLAHLGSVVWFGLPALALATLVALPSALWRAAAGERACRAQLVGALLLGLPYLTCFLVLGRPTVGLLLPVTLALGLALAAGARVLDERAPRAAYVLLSTLLAAQTFVSTAFALHHATTPDALRASALLLAGALPKGALLVAGDAAHHVRWLTDAPVVALPNLVQASGLGPAAAESALGRLRAEGQARLAEHEAVYLSSEAIDWLTANCGVARAELPAADASTIVVRTDPPLALLLFARRGGQGE